MHVYVRTYIIYVYTMVYVLCDVFFHLVRTERLGSCSKQVNPLVYDIASDSYRFLFVSI